MSDVLSCPVRFQTQAYLASGRVGRTSQGMAATTLSTGLVSRSAPVTTAPTLIMHHTAIAESGLMRSPAAFTTAASETRIEAFFAALTEAQELSGVMAAADDGDPIDSQILSYAIQSLLPFIGSLNLSIPVILPLQSGGIGAEWHDFGMNIELRFRRVSNIYVIVEDAQHTIPTFQGPYPDLHEVGFALRELSRRMTASINQRLITQ
jgi:hypothetical protein